MNACFKKGSIQGREGMNIDQHNYYTFCAPWEKIREVSVLCKNWIQDVEMLVIIYTTLKCLNTESVFPCPAHLQ